MITWQKLTVWVGCGIVGNSLRSSDLLMAPVSLNCYKKERRGGVNKIIGLFPYEINRITVWYDIYYSYYIVYESDHLMWKKS